LACFTSKIERPPLGRYKSTFSLGFFHYNDVILKQSSKTVIGLSPGSEANAGYKRSFANA
jgi:hypothetical protein